MKSRILTFAAAALIALSATPASMASQAVNLDDLLNQVRQGRAGDAAENQQRLQQFRSNRAQQQQLLQQAQAAQRAEEARSARLESEFEQNDITLQELEIQLQERLGGLKELFGVLQQAAGDARGEFDSSIIQVQFPDRSDFMTELAQALGETARVPSLEDIERLWFELQREMTESGRVAKFSTTIGSAEGDEVTTDVIRVGAFNAVADGKYLNYQPATNRFLELPRQPQRRFLSKASGVAKNESGLAPFAIDPTRGQLLASLVQAPNLRERIAQGKEVGYVIITIGIIGVLIALWRLFVLTGTSSSVNRQIKNPDKAGNNPLGRVLQVYNDNPQSDVESLELKLGEAILKETPKLNRMLPLLKIIAVVAPLLGLLGTVTGMIVTFQAITLYGTGDPKLMAGGISTALVTTVLGLVVAIPMVFLHTLVASRARGVSEILMQQAAGLVAERSERK